MADPKLVEILKQGSEVWNRWREQQPATLQIDLRGANLFNANLRLANLSQADLSGADLSLAYLRGTNLRNAHLGYAHLRSADLTDADLHSADLCGADLNLADLRGTNLSAADLNHADLRGANLSRANLGDANLYATDLSNAHLRSAFLAGTQWTKAVLNRTALDNLDLRVVIGLEMVRHTGPSSIGLDTIYRSHGQIPETFLRGAGVPETFITQMHAPVASTSPIEFYLCFISYSHQNEDFAKRLYADLQAQGFNHSAKKQSESIQGAISSYKMVVCNPLTRSIFGNSVWQSYQEWNHTLFPFMTPAQVSRKQHCSHQYQMFIDSLEQVQLMRLAHRCFVTVGKVQQWTEMHWARGLHRR